jgi:hypothetical protein
VNLIDVYDAIAWAEEHGDVLELELEGVNLWVALRDVFVRPFSDHRVQAYQRLTGTPSHVDPLTAGPSLPRLGRGEVDVHVEPCGDVAVLRTQRGTPPLDAVRGGILQFHAFRDYSEIRPEGCYDRITDAFADTVAGAVPVVSVVSATPASLATRFARPPWQMLPRGSDQPPAVPGEEDLLRRVGELIRAAHAAGHAAEDRPEFLRQRLRGLMHRADQFGRLIDLVEPAAVQVASYSNADRMAAVIAAQRRGLPAVDVEHGYMGELSAYGRLGFLPETGVSSVPSHFWCWGRESERLLHRSLGTATAAHRPVVGGAPAYHQRDDAPHVVRPLPVDLTARVAAAHRVALLGWQPDMLVHDEEPDLIPAVLREALVRGRPEVLFLLRLHPRSRHLVPLVERELERIGARNVEVHGATHEDLAALLQVTDVLLTSYSTVAFEANRERIPVVLTDAIGHHMMADYIERGLFHAAHDAAGLLTLVDELHSEDVTVIEYVETDPAAPHRALRAIVAP